MNDPFDSYDTSDNDSIRYRYSFFQLIFVLGALALFIYATISLASQAPDTGTKLISVGFGMLVTFFMVAMGDGIIRGLPRGKIPIPKRTAMVVFPIAIALMLLGGYLTMKQPSLNRQGKEHLVKHPIQRQTQTSTINHF